MAYGLLRSFLLASGLLTSVALVLGGASGCNDDGSYLAPDKTSSTTSGTASGGGSGGEGGAGGAGGDEVPVEPPGPPVLTVVNGVNDHDAIKLCLLTYPGDGVGVPPWPSNAAGLGFARGAVVTSLESLVPPGSDLQMHVVAGDLAATAGRDCAQILGLAAGGQGPVFAAALPVVPASALAAERSLLLVPAGCMGAPGQTDPAEALGCGPFYTETTPTLTLVAAPMSRLTVSDRVSYQVVHANAALTRVDVRLGARPSDPVGWLVASGLTFGAVKPFPPTSTLSAADVEPEAEIRVHHPNQTSNPLSTVAMSEVRTRSGLGSTDVGNGKAVVLVAVGAAPGVPAGPFWHALTYALIPADP
ncbi:hypothetical protein [Chondromyces crocatus]|uniref:Secreted protein n=1 Tax=Chondromyces crocatus TaxID=52 RepID=A0A0K1ES84_CHOCO|nr:hypothetical protein [Chondromyces crocatus]AKT43790.1 uncharacterized protein CMC5_080270 [Chondromyces crocatus]